MQDYHNETRITYNAYSVFFSTNIYSETFQTDVKVARIVQLVILGEGSMTATCPFPTITNWQHPATCACLTLRYTTSGRSRGFLFN